MNQNKIVHPIQFENQKSLIEFSYKNEHVFLKDSISAMDKNYKKPAQSRLFKSYNFYDDCIIRHLIKPTGKINKKREKTAVTLLLEKEKTIRYTFEDINKRVNEKYASWINYGVVPGSTLVILNLKLLDRLIHLLLALKLGCKVSLINMDSAQLLKLRLKTINPDFILIDESKISEIHEFQKFVFKQNKLPITALNNYPSYTYDFDEIAFINFDLNSENLCDAVSISADILYLNLLRNGLFAFGIHPNDTLVFSNYRVDEFYIGLQLSSLLFGVNSFFGYEQIFDPKCKLLNAFQSIILDVSTLKPELFNQVKLKKIKYIFSFVGKQNEYDLYLDLLQNKAFKSLPSNYFFWESAIQSIAHISVGKVGEAIQNIFQIPGKKFELYDLIDSDKPSESFLGYYGFPLSKKENFVSRVAINKTENACTYFIKKQAMKNLQIYPQKEICDFLNTDSEISETYTFSSKIDQSTSKNIIKLIVFNYSLMPNQFSTKKEMLIKKIEQNFTKDFLPDRIIFYRYVPRDIDKNTEWLTSQLNTDGIKTKSKDDFFYWLSKYRISIQTLNKHIKPNP